MEYNPVGKKKPDPLEDGVLLWTRARVTQNRFVFAGGGVIFAISSTVAGVRIPSTWGTKLDIALMAVGIGFGVVVVFSVLFSLVVAPVEQRNVLRTEVLANRKQIEDLQTTTVPLRHVEYVHGVAGGLAGMVRGKRPAMATPTELSAFHAHTNNAFFAEIQNWNQRIWDIQKMVRKLRIHLTITAQFLGVKSPDYNLRVIVNRLALELQKIAHSDVLGTYFLQGWSLVSLTAAGWGFDNHDHIFAVPEGCDTETFDRLKEPINTLFKAAQAWSELRAIAAAETARDAELSSLSVRLDNVAHVHDLTKSPDCPICVKSFAQ